MEFDVPVNPDTRLIYLKKEMVKILGANAKAIPNRSAILFFGSDTPLEDVVDSIDIIKQDLQHAIKMAAKKHE